MKDVKELAADYAMVVKNDAKIRWRWTRNLLQLRNASGDKSSKAALDKDLGVRCATVVGRDKPYSPQWVRAHANAASQYPEEPITPEDCRAFLDLCNGVSAKRTKGNKMDAAAALKAMVAFARNAIKLGATTDEVEQAIVDLVRSLNTPAEQETVAEAA